MELDSSLIDQFEADSMNFSRQFEENTKEEESSVENNDEDEQNSKEVHETFCQNDTLDSFEPKNELDHIMTGHIIRPQCF